MLETHCILACFSISIKVISAGPKEEQRAGISPPVCILQLHEVLVCCG